MFVSEQTNSECLAGLFRAFMQRAAFLASATWTLPSCAAHACHASGAQPLRANGRSESTCSPAVLLNAMSFMHISSYDLQSSKHLRAWQSVGTQSNIQVWAIGMSHRGLHPISYWHLHV